MAHSHNQTKLSLPALTAMVVGSMIGAGIFTLPRRFGAQAGVGGALIAWGIAGTGTLMLALVFQRLAIRKPELDSGMYAYAREGFGSYPGFLAAIGYWASACAGNASYWILVTATLSPLIPALGAGNTGWALVVATTGIWGFYLLIRRGVKEAAGLNVVVTVAKTLPLLVFIVVAVTVFDPRVFVANLSGGTDLPGLFGQVRASMLITVFAFLGLEGASVYSRYAKKREDVGRATVGGFSGVLVIFVTISIIAYGVLPRAEIAALPQPSVGAVLVAAVGPWGGIFVAVALIVAVLGAYLSWTLLATEVLYSAARDHDLPRFLARTSTRSVPGSALLLSTLFAQVLLVVAYLSTGALDLMLDLSASMAVVAFVMVGGYAVKVAFGPPDAPGDIRTRRVDLGIAAGALAYTLFLFFVAGWKFALLACVLFLPASLLFRQARRERGEVVFTRAGRIILAVIIGGAIVAVALFASGSLTL